MENSLEIRSQNLSMRPMVQSDWPLFSELNARSEVIKKCFDPLPKEEVKQKFESRLGEWSVSSDKWLTLVITETLSESPIGITGFFVDEGVAEVGYLILPEFSGQGYGTESLYAVIEWAEKHCDLTKFRAIVTKGNVASEKVLVKCGFHLDKVEPLAYEIGGQLYDDLIYLKG